MKKKTQVMLAGLMVAAGVVLLGIGSLDFSVQKTAEEKTESVTVDTFDNYAGNEFEISLNGITSLDLDVPADIKVTSGQGKMIVYGMKNPEDPADDRFESSLSSADGIMSFQYKVPANININWTMKVEIQLPESMDILKVYTSLGDIDIKDQLLDGLELEAALGEIEAENCFTDTLNVTASMGDVSLENVSARAANIDLGLGDLSYEGECEEMAAVVSSGSASITLPKESAKPGLNLYAALGEITVDGKTIGQSEYECAGAGSIQVDCSLGDIEIEYE